MSTSSHPTVSVIIPAFNAAQWLGQTLDSVLVQTFPDFEVIVVDDGSDDDTPRVAAGYGARIRYLRQENRGEPSARNVGIRAARGAFIAFVDADDLWLPEKLELQMRLFARNCDLAWVYSDALAFDGKTGQDLFRIGQVTQFHRGDILRPLVLVDFIPSPTPVIHRDVFDTVGYFDESPDLQIGEDWNMWLRIAAKYQVEFVDRPLARHRLSATSMTGAMDPQYALWSKWRIIENAVARDPERLSDLRKHALANVCVGMAGWRLRRGDRLGARGLFARAARLYPYDARTLAYWLATFLRMSFLKWLLVARRRYRRLKFSTGKVS